MDASDDALRNRINGPDTKTVTSPKRRQKFGAAERTRMRLINAGGILAAAAGIAMALSFGFLGDEDEGAAVVLASSGEAAGEAAGDDDPPAPRITTIDNNALVSDGGRVHRSVPVGLGGARVTGTPAERSGVVRAEPARPEVKIAAAEAGAGADDAGDADGDAGADGADRTAGAAADDRGDGDAGAGAGGTLPQLSDLGADAADKIAAVPVETVSSAIIVARSNLVWARLFAQDGRSYEALKRAPLDAWSEGACGQRAAPAVTSYCELDGTIYATEILRGTAVAVLDLANQIGDHVQESMGVSLRPASGTSRMLRSDCFAGLWAQLDAGAASALAPGALRNALAADAGLTAFERKRLEAFTHGYTSADPIDCEPVGQSG